MKIEKVSQRITELYALEADIIVADRLGANLELKTEESIRNRCTGIKLNGKASTTAEDTHTDGKGLTDRNQPPNKTSINSTI